MYNPLLDSPIDSWRGFAIRTDFRQALKFFRIAEDKDLEENEKAALYIRCFFNTIPTPLDNVFDFIGWYVAGGEEAKKSPGVRVFDFDIDAGRLYAAFMQVYRIDLREENMHWWDFLELFRALPDGTMLARVMDIRGKKIDPKADAKYRMELARAKAAYALEQETMPDIFGAWN
jgi:hypothetical protein